MLVCRSCGSSRIRNGYQPPPLLLRLFFIRTLLCDSCNLQFQAFCVRPPSNSRSKKKRQSRQKPESFSPVSSSVDLNRLNQLAPEMVVSVGEGKITSSGLAAVMERPAQAAISSPPVVPVSNHEIYSSAEHGEAEETPVPLKQSNRPRCPHCHSLHTRRRHRNAVERLLLMFSENRAFTCEGCSRNFYARKPGREATD